MKEILFIIKKAKECELSTWGEAIQNIANKKETLPLQQKNTLQIELSVVQSHYRDLTILEYFMLPLLDVEEMVTYFKW